jgi:hypothetical protein
VKALLLEPAHTAEFLREQIVERQIIGAGSKAAKALRLMPTYLLLGGARQLSGIIHKTRALLLRTSSDRRLTRQSSGGVSTMAVRIILTTRVEFQISFWLKNPGLQGRFRVIIIKTRH